MLFRVQYFRDFGLVGEIRDGKGCVYKILRTKNHGFETRFWNTVLQKSVYKSFLPSVFLALSDCAIAHLILHSLYLGKRSNRARAFLSRSKCWPD